MRQNPHLKKWQIALAIYTLTLLAIFYLAYRQGIPGFIGTVPYYDLIGHFVLYGMWGYLTYRALNKRLIGPAALTGVIILEELLQQLSSHRTFSLMDMLFGILGMWGFISLDKWIAKSKINQIKEPES